MNKHPVRLFAATFTVLVWGVLIAGTAHAKVGPDDPNDPYITQPPVIVVEPVSWTRYALVALLAILFSVAATLAVQAVIRRGRPSMAHS